MTLYYNFNFYDSVNTVESDENTFRLEFVDKRQKYSLEANLNEKFIKVCQIGIKQHFTILGSNFDRNVANIHYHEGMLSDDPEYEEYVHRNRFHHNVLKFDLRKNKLWFDGVCLDILSTTVRKIFKMSSSNRVLEMSSRDHLFEILCKDDENEWLFVFSRDHFYCHTVNVDCTFDKITSIENRHTLSLRYDIDNFLLFMTRKVPTQFKLDDSDDLKIYDFAHKWSQREGDALNIFLHKRHVNLNVIEHLVHNSGAKSLISCKTFQTMLQKLMSRQNDTFMSGFKREKECVKMVKEMCELLFTQVSNPRKLEIKMGNNKVVSICDIECFDELGQACLVVEVKDVENGHVNNLYQLAANMIAQSLESKKNHVAGLLVVGDKVAVARGQVSASFLDSLSKNQQPLDSFDVYVTDFMTLTKMSNQVLFEKYIRACKKWSFQTVDDIIAEVNRIGGKVDKKRVILAQRMLLR